MRPWGKIPWEHFEPDPWLVTIRHTYWGFYTEAASTFDRSPATCQRSKRRKDLLYSQLTQGNDTDSFGATAGSLLGAYFGPGYLEERWLAPFTDDIHTALAWFYERSLSKLAKRMGKLPKRIAEKIMP